MLIVEINAILRQTLKLSTVDHITFIIYTLYEVATQGIVGTTDAHVMVSSERIGPIIH